MKIKFKVFFLILVDITLFFLITRGFSIKEIIECFNLKILILMILELVLFINNKKILIFDLNVDYFIFEIKSSKSKFVKSSRKEINN